MFLQAGSDIKEHFCAFVHVADVLYELDGSLERGAISHGATSPETFLADVAGVVQRNFVSLDPQSNSWNIMALAKASA